MHIREKIFLLIFLIIFISISVPYQISPDNRKKISQKPKIFIYIRPSNPHNICWIFNKTIEYQVLISFCSIIKNNPHENFNFYFVIPQKATVDLRPFNHFLPVGSKIEIRHFKPQQSTLPRFGKLNCTKPSIIIVKIHLKDILPELDTVLYLDADMINVAPLSAIWRFDVKGKTMAVTKRIHMKNWVNSGFVYYNLKDLRKRPKRLFMCAERIYPCNVDDSWHTNCNKRKAAFVDYRYNVEFLAMIYKKNRTSVELNEEKNAVFYHLKDKENRPFYHIKRNELKNLEYVKKLGYILPTMEKLFDIREWVDSELHKLNIQNYN